MDLIDHYFLNLFSVFDFAEEDFDLFAVTSCFNDFCVYCYVCSSAIDAEVCWANVAVAVVDTSLNVHSLADIFDATVDYYDVNACFFPLILNSEVCCFVAADFFVFVPVDLNFSHDIYTTPEYISFDNRAYLSNGLYTHNFRNLRTGPKKKKRELPLLSELREYFGLTA